MKLCNVSQSIKQPNGEIVQCCASGNSRSNWLHDKNGYIILQNKKTGEYRYAKYEGGELVPSDVLATNTSLGISDISIIYPNAVKIQDVGINAIINNMKKSYSIPSSFIANTPSIGTINNVVVFIRFSDETEFTNPLSYYGTLFNDSTPNINSVYNYFKSVSYNNLNVTSSFFPTSTTTAVVSYQDSQPRGYYQPYSTTNTIGYTEDNDQDEDEDNRRIREHMLLKNALEFVKPQIEALPINLDEDEDGYVDNIGFIIKGGPTAWSTLLWPHQWALYTYTVTLKGKRVGNYNFHLDNMVDVSVLCHELLHSIGFQDLYHYSYDDIDPIGTWDIMDQNTNPPQQPSVYSKYRHTNWISSIPEITVNGTYTLNPSSASSNNCFLIRSLVVPSEYFVIEYRKKSTIIDSMIAGSGLVIYRINSYLEGQGNAIGPPDEVHVLRRGETAISNGDLVNNYLTSDVGRTQTGGTTYYITHSNGEDSGIGLTNIGSAGNTISFLVTLPTNKTADVAITQSATPNPVVEGGLITYNLIISNKGPQTAQGIVMTDTLPQVIQAAQYSVDRGNTWNTWDGRYTIDSLVVNESISVLIRGTVCSLATGSISNTATVTTTTTDPDLSNNTATVITSIGTLTGADVSIVKTADVDEVVVGSSLTYKLVICNAGPSTAQGVVVSDAISEVIQNPVYSLDQGNTWSTWNGCYTVASLAVRACLNIWIRGIVSSGATGTIINTATVMTRTLDPDLSNNCSCSSVNIGIGPVESEADVSIVKTANANQIMPGGRVIYTLSIRNIGPDTAENVVVRDILPNMVLDAKYSMDEGVTWSPWKEYYSLGTLIKGVSSKILIKGTISLSAKGNISSSATVTSSTPDPNLTNNTDTVVIFVPTCYKACNYYQCCK